MSRSAYPPHVVAQAAVEISLSRRLTELVGPVASSVRMAQSGSWVA